MFLGSLQLEAGTMLVAAGSLVPCAQRLQQHWTGALLQLRRATAAHMQSRTARVNEHQHQSSAGARHLLIDAERSASAAPASL